MISTSSVLSALILYSIMLVGVCLLRRVTWFLKKYGVSVLLVMSAFAAIRLLLPFEISVTYAFRSWNLLGITQRYLREHPAVERGLLAIWASGAVVAVGWNVLVFWIARRRCRRYRIVDSEVVRRAAERVNVECPVLVSPDVEVPCAAGVLQCAIYLPDADLPEREIELILAHEAQHIRNKDAQIKLAVGLLTAVMWWNPVAHLFQREIGRLLELRCDAKVTEHMDLMEQTEYLTMLRNMAGRIVSRKRAPALALDESQVIGRKKETFIQQRFEVILSYNGKPPRRMGMAVRCVLLALFCASYLVILQPAGLAPAENFQDDARTSYEDNYEGRGLGDGANGAFIYKEADGRYKLFVNYTFSRYLSEDEVASDEYQDLLICEETE